MIKKILNSKDSIFFIKSSSVVFLANIITAIFSYVLIIIVSRKLTNISNWTALNVFIMIIGVIINGVAVDVSKRSAEFEKISINESFKYLNTLKISFKKVTPWFLILSPFFALFIQKILGTHFLIAFIVLLNIPAQLFLNINNHFLMGIFHYKNYASNILFINFVRFLTTVLFLFLGFDIYSLPMGISISVLIGWLQNHIYLKKIKIENYITKIEYDKKYSLSKEAIEITNTIFANLSFQLPFLIFPIIANVILDQKDSDIFAIFFTIGQMINFGVVAFLTLIVPFATKQNTKKIFWYSIIFTIIAGFCSVLFFIFFRNFVLLIFARPEYSIYVKEMVIYFTAIALYNLLFFIGRYNIGKGNQKILFPLFYILGIFILGIFLFKIYSLYLFLISILIMILTSILVLILGNIIKR